MAVLANKSGAHAALGVKLVSDREERRAEVRAVLASIDDPLLEITDALPAPETPDNGAGPVTPAEVAIVIFNGDEESPLAYLQAKAESSPRPVLFAVLGERSPALMRRVLRAGADELLFLPLDKGDVIRALLKISEMHRRIERHQGGLIFSLASVVGGVGVTSLSANLALALHYTLNKRVALIDLALQAGGLSVYLNIDPDRTILPLARADKKLDSIQLEAALTKHGSGVYLLAAPKRIEDAEIVSDLVVGSVLELTRQLFDFVVVDCGTHIDENSVAAWERSSDVLYVLDQSISAARCAWRFIDLFGKLGIKDAELRFIMNRFDSRHPITEKQIAHTLGRPIYAKIPHDEKTLERVQLRAEDLWTINSNAPVTRAVEELARRLGAGPAEETRHGRMGLMARLLSAVGARTSREMTRETHRPDSA